MFYKVAFYQVNFIILLITIVSYFLPSWFDARTFILGFIVTILIGNIVRKKLQAGGE